MRRALVSGSFTASFVESGDVGAEVRVACIHGAAHSGDVFRPLFDAPALAAMHRVGIDLPGRFGSPNADRSTARDAEFVRMTLAALPPVRRTVLLGHSYGGAVALELALADRGSAVDALVLVSTGARLRVRADILTSYERAARGEAPSPRGLGFSTSVDPAIVATLERAFESVPPGASFEDWRSANAFDRMGELAAIRIPTLILAGEDDPFTPMKYGEFLASRIVGAELVRIEHGSHMAIVEDAAIIADAIAHFTHIAFSPR